MKEAMVEEGLEDNKADIMTAARLATLAVASVIRDH